LFKVIFRTLNSPIAFCVGLYWIGRCDIWCSWFTCRLLHI